MVSDDELEAILVDRGADLDALAAELVNAANANGGRDNISVVLVTSP